MDKNRRYQLSFIIVGVFLIFLGVYLHLLVVEFIIASTVFIGGIVLLISGTRYKERLNRKVLEGEERSEYLRSNYFIVSMIGAVTLFSGLGAAVLASYMGATVTAFWLLGIVFVGMLILVVGSFLKKNA